MKAMKFNYDYTAEAIELPKPAPQDNQLLVQVRHVQTHSQCRVTIVLKLSHLTEHIAISHIHIAISQFTNCTDCIKSIMSLFSTAFSIFP